VKNKLSKHPELRDSNERLYYHYLLDIGYDITKPFKEALKDMEGRVIPFIDSIARASRKVQEETSSFKRKNLWEKKNKI